MFKCGSGLFSFRKRWRPAHTDYIDKSHCNLSIVPDDVLRHERHLEELLLEANQIRELPRAIFRMNKLRKLILSDNQILDLTSELGNLVALEEFDISKNDIRGVPDCVDKLKSLKYIDVSNNTLGELPDSITKLMELHTLVVNDVALGEIPPEIGSLKGLSVLELRDNCIRFLPMSFSFLENLQKLDLGGNELEELPDTIGALTNLTELWLDNNYLTNLPIEIGELRLLQCLDVSENRIEDLPEEIGGLESLTLLIVSSNSLHELPDGIGLLTNLQILKVEQNELDDLNGSICGCVSLEELMLTDNSIEFLPPSIGHLRRLTNLNVDRNRLYTLPSEIGNCQSLILLCARDNQIDKVPKEIGNCRNLTVLDLAGNKLENLPLTVSSLPLKALWLSQNQSQSVLKLQVDDDAGDEKVLTCFLFPQEKLKPSCSIENFMNDVYDVGDEKAWKSIVPKPSTIQFEGDDDHEHKEPQEEIIKEEPQSEHPNESNLTRKGTPYPKELRDRHPHLIMKRSGPDSTMEGTIEDSYQHEGEKVGVTMSANVVVIGDDGGIDNPYLLDEDDKPEEVEVEEEKVQVVKQVKLEEKDVDSSQDSAEGSSDEDLDSEGEKHVAFIVNEAVAIEMAENQFNDDVCRLQRKDTPHHFKGKRIVNDDSDKERLQEILSSIENRKSSEADDDEDAVDGVVEMEKPVVSFQNGNKEEDSDEDDTDDEEKDSEGIPFRYKKATFQDPECNVEVEEVPLNDEQAKENGEVVTMEDGCEQVLDEEIMKLYEELTTTIYRDGPSLGINIAGGLGTASFEENEQLADLETRQFEDEGVVITKVAPEGPAGKEGILKVGDKIIKVNDFDISQFSHDDAVQALRNAGNTVTLIVLREVTNEDEINLSLSQREEKIVRFAAEPEVEDIEIEAVKIHVLLKRDGKGLGFSIAGGKGSNPYKGSDEGIYISKISEDGPAALDERLQLGDKLLSINGIDVRSSSHEDVVKILTGADDKVSLVAYREKILNKQMKPMSQINGVDAVKTAGESTEEESIPNNDREEDEPKLLVEEIILKKNEGPLGISIVGGSDHASHPFGVNEPGVFVSKVNPAGEAAKTNLCVGDRILRVNDKDMRTALHHEAVEALVSNDAELKLLVRHDPPPPGIQEISIDKKLGEKLGISIRGGAKGHPGNPFDKEDEGIFVSKVNASGAASRSGQLKVGMRILEVNSVSLLGATHVDAVRALRTAGDNLAMVVADGYDPALIETNQDDILFNPSLCEPARFSPDSVSSATSGDSFGDDSFNYHNRHDDVTSTPVIEMSSTLTITTTPSATSEETNDAERKSSGNQVKRTPSEQRAIEADKRAKWRQERMAALDNDSKKAQAVIQQSKQFSSNSLDDGSIISDVDERTSS